MLKKKQHISYQLHHGKEIRDRKPKYLQCLFTYVNPIFCKYGLQIRQGEFCGLQFLILPLTFNKISVNFTSRGSNFQIFGHK